MTAEKPKPFTFFIRGLQMTTVVERMFHVDSASERAGWLEAIERVKKKLDEVRLTKKRNFPDFRGTCWNGMNFFYCKTRLNI